MKSLRARVRSTVAALLVSLVALWAFGLVMAGREVQRRWTTGQLWPQGMTAIGLLALVIALGFVAIFASLSISIISARRLRALRAAADELAQERLPTVVARLGRGEDVDVAVEAPPLETGRDEIGQVSAAFNRVQETAVRVAVEQAELRRGVHDVFLSLARRSQALLHRQLGQLDAMERRADSPDELAELFRVDHLATRMRRNAENLIVLSGSAPGRSWRKPVPLVDVLRAALAEVEDFSRVTVLPPEPAALIGPAVGDVIHLLAELVENAVAFSPPQTTVRVGGARVGDEFVIEIEDRGVGLSTTRREAANAALREPPEFLLTGSAQLGLFVVGRLARRQRVRVELRPSPYGGTTAVVTIPGDLITEVVPAGAGPDDPRTPGGALRPTGPTRSDPVAVAASGLPVRRRPSTEGQAGNGHEPPLHPASPARPEFGQAVPLPGMDHLGPEPGDER